MKIGNLDLGKQPLFLAPMEDVTDPPFRYLCKHFGADVVYTEFVASEGLIRECKKSVKKLELFDFERPAAIQLYGHQVESMLRLDFLWKMQVIIVENNKEWKGQLCQQILFKNFISGQ